MPTTDIVKVSYVNKEGVLRVVIPQEARDKLKIKAGDKLIVSYDKSGNLIYRKVQSL